MIVLNSSFLDDTSLLKIYLEKHPLKDLVEIEFYVKFKRIWWRAKYLKHKFEYEGLLSILKEEDLLYYERI